MTEKRETPRWFEDVRAARLTLVTCVILGIITLGIDLLVRHHVI